MTKQTKLTLSISLLAAVAIIAVASCHYADQGEPGHSQPTTHEAVGPAQPSDDVLPHGEQPAAALFGYKPQPAETREFLRSLPKATIREAGPQLFQARGPPQDAFLYRALYAAHQQKLGRPWTCGAQGIGDCVSWGWAHGIDVAAAVAFLRGDIADWKPVATESIYGGSRVEARGRSTGGYSDGSYGSAAAKWVKDWGAIYRESYPSVDLSTYSSKRAKDWGNYGNGGQGDDGKLDNEAKKSPVRSVALVKTFDEAAAAIQSGYPIPVCSGQGFTSRRDDDGFCQASGSWAHCMCFTAVRHGDRPGLLCQNSWGPTWVSGPKWPDDQPDGSFWVDKATVDKMLRQNDSFSVSGYDGFPFKEIDHAGWVNLGQPADDVVYALAL